MDYLTDDDISLLRRVLRDDAYTQGFGYLYFSSDKSRWPRSLKNNLRVMNKLNREWKRRRSIEKQTRPTF